MAQLRLILSLLLCIIATPEISGESPASAGSITGKGLLVLLLEEAETSERFEIISSAASGNEPVPGELFEWLLNLEPSHLKEQLTAELLAARLDGSLTDFEKMIRENAYYYARFAHDFHKVEDSRLRALLVRGAVYSGRSAYFLGRFLEDWRYLSSEGKSVEISVRELNALVVSAGYLTKEERRSIRASASLLYLNIEGNQRTAALRRFLDL